MENFDKFEILFKGDNVIFRTVDNIGYPVDIWRFEKDKLTDTEKVFIDNIKSMATSVISQRERASKPNPNCKCKNCGCQK